MPADLTFNTKAALHPNGAVDTPYTKAVAQLRQDLTVERRRLANWQRHCAVLAVVALAAIGSTVIAVCRIQTFTSVVEVAETGQIRTIGILPQTWRGAAPAVIDAIVKGWLYNMRRVGIDPVQNHELRRMAGAFMTLPAIRMSERHMVELKALEQRGATTQLTILSALPMVPDAHVMQLEWDETTVSRSGTIDATVRWRAIVNVVIYAERELPKDLKERKDLRNQLGIFVEDYAWQPLTEDKGKP